MRNLTIIYAGCLILLGSMLTACGGSSSSNSSEDSTTASGEDLQTKNAILTELKLKKKWETDTSVRAPESALWDSTNQILYVSNINGDGNAKDNNGFISILNEKGDIQELHWVDGLDAPKGLGMYNGNLYVADLDQLVIIDIADKKIMKKIPVPGATFLNDITVDEQGRVYLSDTRQNKVYRYADGKVSAFLEGPDMKGVNGLLIWKNKLWILTASGLYNCDPETKLLSLFTEAVKGGDGLVAVNDRDFIASRWAGEVYYINADGTAKKLLDTKKLNKNTADICFIPEQQLLVVPTFNGNTVAGYQLERTIEK